MKIYSKIILVAILMTSFFSCEKDPSDDSIICNVENPAEDLPWLKTMIATWEANPELYKYMYVLQGQYKGQNVFVKNAFVIGNCCPTCNSSFPAVYNCEGELLDLYRAQIVAKPEPVWESSDSPCILTTN